MIKKDVSLSGKQLDLFGGVAASFVAYGEVDNHTLYCEVARRIGADSSSLDKLAALSDGRRYNPFKRKVRWVQQTMKHLGLIEQADRGIWRLTSEGRKRLDLRRINTGHVMLAFSTGLGVALWADCRSAFPSAGEPIQLVVTSPPFPLARPRAYGNPGEAEYVDFLCQAIEPIVRRLAPGASIVLDLSNDIFLSGLPARSLYRERLVLALADRFGLSKMDEIPWINRSKPPGPVQWASIRRSQLNSGWQPVYWFCNDPKIALSDNRRVLKPHSQRHLELMHSGGEQRDRINCDGAYRLRRGRSYAHITEGCIPKNVLERGHHCGSQMAYKAAARRAGLPVHGAPFPLDLAEFFIRFLTVEGDLVADPFGGSLTVALAAEKLGRHWIATEVIWEYLAGGGLRFDGTRNFQWNSGFQAVSPHHFNAGVGAAI